MVEGAPQHRIRARPKLFIDSGAYSAKTQGVKISVYQYISFLKRWNSYIDTAASLDVIGDGEGTWRNQQVMEGYGEKPIPTYHTGEDLDLLQMYIQRYPYIALGGNVGRSADELMGWLDEMWDRYLTNAAGLPIIRVHAFGVTSPEIMTRYPWYSVDSTSWLLAAATGKAAVCDTDLANWPWLRMLPISDKSPDLARDQHFDSMRPTEKEGWARLFESKHYSIKTLRDDYRERFFCNAQAYVEFAERTPSYRRFVPPTMGLFPTTKLNAHRAPADAWPHLTMYLAGNPGASNITAGLMRKGYNRLLSYHYITDSMSHFNEAREVLDTWETSVSNAQT